MALPGVGVVQVGMAGAGTALLNDSAATLRNPATGVFLETGSTWDLALAFPTADYSASPAGNDSRASLFEYQAGGYRSVYKLGSAPSYARLWRVSERWAWGVGLFGAGIGSTMPDGEANIARGIPLLASECDGDFGGGDGRAASAGSSQCGGAGAKAGIQVTQINLGLHLSYRPSDWLGIGLSPVIGAQQFRIQGLSAFAPYSVDPSNVTDRDHDYSWGLGYRLGLHLRPSATVEFGLSYQPRMKQSQLDRYAGALVGDSLDIPGNLNVGLHWRITPRHSLVLDWDQIRYDEVRPLAASPDKHDFVNQCVLPRLVGLPLLTQEDTQYCLGGDKGPGFGWGRMTMLKAGYEMRLQRWAWRIGYSRGGSPIKTLNALMTALAPSVVSEHVAAGLSWDHSASLNIGLALSYAIRDQKSVVNGLSNVSFTTQGLAAVPGLLNGSQGLLQLDVENDADDQTVTISMDTWQVQVGLTWRLEAFH